MPSICIPGTTPHCLVSTEGNVNFLGTRSLVYRDGYAYVRQTCREHPFILSATTEQAASASHSLWFRGLSSELCTTGLAFHVFIFTLIWWLVME